MKLRKAFILNPSQSRRLIARAIVHLPQVQYALKEGKIFIGRGATNAYILEELFKHLNITDNFNKGDFVAGQIVPGNSFMRWWINKGNRKDEIYLVKGVVTEFTDRAKIVEKFQEGDLIFKGANALDSNGVPGVLAGGNGGGTIGSLSGIIQSRGIEVICPIGLEKMILGDLVELQSLMGIANMDHPAEGIPCGLIPMSYATVFTEIEALELLFDCEAYQVAAGGVGGAEGSVSILVNGYDKSDFQKLETFMQEVAKEPTYQPNV